MGNQCCAKRGAKTDPKKPVAGAKGATATTKIDPKAKKAAAPAKPAAAGAKIAKTGPTAAAGAKKAPSALAKKPTAATKKPASAVAKKASIKKGTTAAQPTQKQKTIQKAGTNTT